MVTELPFGFWRYLLASRYERTLWRTGLYRAFPGQGRRQAVYARLASVHQLRNRIAHHEPVHNRPLARLHSDALLVAEWACPGTQTWIAARSTVPRLLSTRPQPAPLASHRSETTIRLSRCRAAKRMLQSRHASGACHWF